MGERTARIGDIELARMSIELGRPRQP